MDILKIDPQRISNRCFEMLKIEAKYSNDIVNSLKAFGGLDKQKLQVDNIHIINELTYLNIFITVQAIIDKFTTYYPYKFEDHFSYIVEDHLIGEIEEFIRNKTNDDFTFINIKNILSAMDDYINIYNKLNKYDKFIVSNQLITEIAEITEGVRKFAEYILLRIFKDRKIVKNRPLISFILGHYNRRILYMKDLLDKAVASSEILQLLPDICYPFLIRASR